MIPHSVFDIASAASILFVFFLLLFIYFFYVSSFLSFRLWPASRSTEIISQYLGKKKLHRIMYYNIVLLQRVGKKKKNRPAGANQNGKQEGKKLLQSNQRGLELFLFFMLFFGV